MQLLTTRSISLNPKLQIKIIVNLYLNVSSDNLVVIKLLVDECVYSLHLTAKQCIDTVRRKCVLITWKQHVGHV